MDRDGEEKQEGGGEGRGGRGGWRGRETRMLMRATRRKEEERENIDLRQRKAKGVWHRRAPACSNSHHKCVRVRGGGRRNRTEVGGLGI